MMNFIKTLTLRGSRTERVQEATFAGVLIPDIIKSEGGGRELREIQKILWG